MSKVFVGLSGGVDSAVAAALLKEQGFDVHGIYMKNWSRDIAGHTCPWQEDLQSARSVAAHAQIPFTIYDFEKEYFEEVTKYMVSTYQQGLTPNPDVMCNQKIKFDTFYNKCLSEGAEYVATGHYARLSNQSQQISLSDLPVSTDSSKSTARSLASDLPRTSSELDAQVNLMKAVDETKDQTYFLYRMNPRIAKQIIFPLGNLKKTDVRKLAQKFNLPNHARPDSQGLCFVGNVPMRDFLSEFIKPQKGKTIDEHGKKLGEHQGAFAFTIGQRHGLGIGGGQPYFVYEIDTKNNTVRVTSDEDSPLLNKKEFTICDCIWWQKPEAQSKLEVRVRYRSKTNTCEIKSTGKDQFKVTLQNPERAIAPGQSAVFYNGSTVVGGGIIQ